MNRLIGLPVLIRKRPEVDDPVQNICTSQIGEFAFGLAGRGARQNRATRSSEQVGELQEHTPVRGSPVGHTRERVFDVLALPRMHPKLLLEIEFEIVSPACIGAASASIVDEYSEVNTLGVPRERQMGKSAFDRHAGESISLRHLVSQLVALQPRSVDSESGEVRMFGLAEPTEPGARYTVYSTVGPVERPLQLRPVDFSGKFFAFAGLQQRVMNHATKVAWHGQYPDDEPTAVGFGLALVHEHREG